MSCSLLARVKGEFKSKDKGNGKGFVPGRQLRGSLGKTGALFLHSERNEGAMLRAERGSLRIGSNGHRVPEFHNC